MVGPFVEDFKKAIKNRRFGSKTD
ncbi:hypothetical protein ACMGEU_14650 [Staphylococcus aureus]